MRVSNKLAELRQRPRRYGTDLGNDVLYFPPLDGTLQVGGRMRPIKAHQIGDAINMPTIECHGCLRQVEEQEVRWIKSLGGPVRHTDDGGLEIHPVEFDHPEPGAVPYCATCRESPNDSDVSPDNADRSDLE